MTAPEPAFATDRSIYFSVDEVPEGLVPGVWLLVGPPGDRRILEVRDSAPAWYAEFPAPPDAEAIVALHNMALQRFAGGTITC